MSSALFMSVCLRSAVTGVKCGMTIESLMEKRGSVSLRIVIIFSSLACKSKGQLHTPKKYSMPGTWWLHGAAICTDTLGMAERGQFRFLSVWPYSSTAFRAVRRGNKPDTDLYISISLCLYLESHTYMFIYMHVFSWGKYPHFHPI